MYSGGAYRLCRIYDYFAEHGNVAGRFNVSWGKDILESTTRRKQRAMHPPVIKINAQ